MIFFFFNASSSLFPQQNQMRALIPSLIVALRHLIKADEVGAPSTFESFAPKLR